MTTRSKERVDRGIAVLMDFITAGLSCKTIDKTQSQGTMDNEETIKVILIRRSEELAPYMETR